MTPLKSRLQLALLNRKKGRNALEKGFTLVELMIVIVIVGILSAIALPNFLSQTEKAKATEAKTKMSAIVKQGHAEWQEAGETTDAEALALSESGSKFNYKCGRLDTVGTRTADAVGGDDAFLCVAVAVPAASGGDASLADKAAFACVNLVTGKTDVSSGLVSTAAAGDTVDTYMKDPDSTGKTTSTWPAIDSKIDCASIS